MENFILKFIFIVCPFLFIIYLNSRNTLLFKHRCNICEAKDKNWNIVATGHDDFSWQHNCKINKGK